MKDLKFKKLLFKSAFFVMACDGEIHKDEVLEIKELIANTPHFKGFAYQTELTNCVNLIKSKGKEVIELFWKELKSENLTEEEELQIVEIVVRMIDADGKIDESELLFLSHLFPCLSCSQEQLLDKYPTHHQKLKEFSSSESGDTFKGPKKDLDFSELKIMPVFLLY